MRIRWIASWGLAALIAALFLPNWFTPGGAGQRLDDTDGETVSSSIESPVSELANSELASSGMPIRSDAPLEGAAIPSLPADRWSIDGSNRAARGTGDRREFSFELPHPLPPNAPPHQPWPNSYLGTQRPFGLDSSGSDSPGPSVNPTTRAWAPIPPPGLSSTTTPPDRSGFRHTIELGETLQSISTLYYGHPGRYLDIYEHNAERIDDPIRLPIGREIMIPSVRDQ